MLQIRQNITIKLRSFLRPFNQGHVIITILLTPCNYRYENIFMKLSPKTLHLSFE